MRTPSFNSGELNQRDQSDLDSHLSHSSPGCTGVKMPGESFAGRSMSLH